MMKTLKLFFKTAVLSGLLLMSSAAYSGSQTGTIAWLAVRASDGLVYFALTGSAKVNSPACAVNQYWMIKNENSNTGKQQYATLLSAYLTGKNVEIGGLDTCTRWGDGEDVNTVRLIP